MKERYEEYRHFKNNIPFILNEGIERSSLLHSTEANWHDDPELQLCTRGAGYVIVGGERIEFQEGDIIAVDAGLLHYTGTEDTLTYTCLIADKEFCRAAGIDPALLHFRTRITDPSMRDCFFTLLNHVHTINDPCRTAQLRADLLSLLICLRSHHCLGEKKEAENRELSTVKEAISYIRIHHAKQLTLDEIAKAVYVNKYVLSRTFKASVGMTVFEYLASYRCLVAAQLILEGSRVSEAAEACGFSNLSYFSRTFRRYMGILPSEQKAKSSQTS